VVLLSPGGTSFDAFPDFAARGVHFRDLVAALQAVVGNARGMRME
jgi:UDP-N-acetylmuramoylalanine--D-glutamate ligase